MKRDIGSNLANARSWVSGCAPWAESFLYAGTSALLLLVASLFPAYWYLSFVALTPFLYRIMRAGVTEALRLGFLLGLSFFVVSSVDSLLFFPLATILKIAGGTLLFSLFGLAIGLARRRWGFNPFLVALLWVGFEFGLIKLGLAGGMFENVSLSSPFLHGMAALFGFLVVSVVIVLVASFLVLAIDKAIKLAGARRRSVAVGRSSWVIDPAAYICFKQVYLVPEGRGPPTSNLLFV